MSPVQQKPILHGRDHACGGADPIPGICSLFPGGDTLDALILALEPAGFWKLNEDSGTIAYDSSGFGNDLTADTAAPLWGAAAGPPGEQCADFMTGSPGAYARVARSWAVIDDDFTAGIWINWHDSGGSPIMGQGNPNAANVEGWELEMSGDVYVAATMQRSTSGSESVYSLNLLDEDEWAFVAMTYNATTTTFKLYIDGLLQDESASFTFEPVVSATPLWIGHSQGYGTGSPGQATFNGSYAFYVPRVVSGAELLAINDSTDPLTPHSEAGYVLTVAEDGTLLYAPPTIEVSF